MTQYDTANQFANLIALVCFSPVSLAYFSLPITLGVLTRLQMVDDQIPRIEDLLAPIVHVLKQLGGTADISDIERRVERQLSLPVEVLKRPHPKDSRTELSYRQAWARTRLKNAGFLRNPSRSVWSLTKDAENLSETDLEFLPYLVNQRLSENRIEPVRLRSTKRNKKAPRAPTQRYGPRFQETSGGFDVVADLPSNAEANNPTQVALRKQILDKIETLKPLAGRIANTHPTLLSEFNKYSALISVEITQIDIVSTWTVGAALHGILEATRNLSNDSMTEPLEPEIQGELNALMALHAAFLLGFKIGRELTSRAQAFANANRNIAETAQETSNVLRPMLSSPGLLAARAHQIIDSLNSTIETANYRTALLVQTGIDTATNSLIAYGRSLLKVTLATGAFIDIVVNLYGDPNWEPVRAAVKFLTENRGAIAVFAAHNPELKLWLEWTIERARAFADQANNKRL